MLAPNGTVKKEVIGIVENIRGVTEAVTGTPFGGRVALKLVAAVRQWARERACRHVLVHATSGIEPARTDRFFRRCGFNVVGGNYVY